MRISYRPLWVILAEREMSKKDLRELSGISTASLAKLGKGENLTTDVLLKICEALNCNLKLRTPETLMRQGFIGFSDIRRHHIMHTVSGTFPINRAVLP